jgi:hypothetical protein
MAHIEKDQVTETTGRDHDNLPHHNPDMERTRTNIDVIQMTTENPYKELNFIGTYITIAIGCCAAFASYIMPVTAIVEINAIIGKRLYSYVKASRVRRLTLNKDLLQVMYGFRLLGY